MKNRLRETIPDIVMIVVLVLWSLSLILNMLDRSYAIPPGLQTAMAIILGALFGNRILRKGASSGKDEFDSNRSS